MQSELISIQKCANPAATIVFIHGLDGHPQTTWGFDRERSWHTWITTSHPDVDIWTLRYRLSASWWFGGSMPLPDRALNALAVVNDKISRHVPIVLIGHSYGGLLAKQMLRSGTDVARQFEPLMQLVNGVVLFATPNQGSQISDYVQALSRLAGRFSVLARFSPAVRELEFNAPGLRDLNLWFRQYADRRGLLIRCYHETIPAKGTLVVVNEASSDPGVQGVASIPIDADHFDICKPAERNFCAGDIVDLIRDCIANPPSRIYEPPITAPPTTRRDRFDSLKSAAGAAGDPVPDPWSTVERRVKQLQNPDDIFKIEDA